MDHGISIRQVYQPLLVFFLVQSVRLFASSDYHLAMLKHELAFTRRAAYAESTKTAHMLHWKTYAKFCLYFGLQITPANPETICLFTQFLARSFKGPQSVVNYVASVKLWHSLLDFDMTAFNSLEFILTKKGLFRILAHIPNQARLFHAPTRTSSGCSMLHRTVHALWNLYGNQYRNRAETEEETIP